MKSVWWPYTQSVTNMGYINKRIKLKYNYHILIYNGSAVMNRFQSLCLNKLRLFLAVTCVVVVHVPFYVPCLAECC